MTVCASGASCPPTFGPWTVARYCSPSSQGEGRRRSCRPPSGAHPVAATTVRLRGAAEALQVHVDDLLLARQRRAGAGHRLPLEGHGSRETFPSVARVSFVGAPFQRARSSDVARPEICSLERPESSVRRPPDDDRQRQRDASRLRGVCACEQAVVADTARRYDERDVLPTLRPAHFRIALGVDTKGRRGRTGTDAV